MEKPFNGTRGPDHLSRGVVAGIVVFAFTENLYFYAAALVLTHAASSALEVYRARKRLAVVTYRAPEKGSPTRAATERWAHVNRVRGIRRRKG